MLKKANKRPRWWAERRKSVDIARQLRREQTRAEVLLWEQLRGRRLAGLKFRRQHVRDRYVLDFFNAEHHLAIELDGAVHGAQAQQDAERTAYLNEVGISVLRFMNNEVETNLDDVLRRIAEACGMRL